MKLPTGTRLISVDNHWEISVDIFYENFPAQLKEKAPRVWFDKFWRIGYRGKVEALPIGKKVEELIPRTIGEGVWNPEVRYRDLDLEGVQEEMVFPNTLIGFARYPEFEVQEQLYRVYNEHYAAGHINKNPRSHAIGIFSNWWDPAAAERAMREIVDLGLKTFMIPVNPGKSIEGGKEISYGDAIMDRFWDVVAEAGLPVCFHVGEGTDLDHRGGQGELLMTLLAPFRKPFGQLVFGGVFDRHPNLRIVFAEGGIAWVPPALQDAEAIFDSFGNDDIIHIDHRPSHYWHNNCYATFQSDPLGLKQLDIIGADRVMWATDYPHSEGSFGYGRETVRAVVDATSAEDARAILGGTAIKLYRLDS